MSDETIHPEVDSDSAMCPECGSDDPDDRGVVAAHDPGCWGNCEKHGCPIPEQCRNGFHEEFDADDRGYSRADLLFGGNW